MFDPAQLQSDGFGEATVAELAELRKALEIGYQQPTTGTGFDALRVESLEQTLKLLTYSAEHIRLWNQIPKDNAFSTVEEYNRLVSYGDDGGGFVPSGELPEEEDTTYERTDQKVKFVGSTRSIHHPATLVRTVPPDLVAQETSNGALWIMGKVNTALYTADADVVPVEWNGLTKQIISGGGLVVDLEGAPLAQDDIEDSVQQIIDNFGNPSLMFSAPKVFHDFSKLQQNNQRFAGPNVNAGMAGVPITGYKTISGDINFQPDTFVRRGGVPPTSATHPKAPNAPTVSMSAATGTTGNFLTADVGTYKWQVTAVNRFGESAPTAITGGVAVSATNYVPYTITDGGGAYDATGYHLYRTEKGGSTTYFTQKRIARSKVSGVYQPTTSDNDDNGWRPRCYTGLILDMTPQSLIFKQLAPMMKMNLAIISPAIRWMQLLYGTPIVFAPGKNLVLKNIGVAS